LAFNLSTVNHKLSTRREGERKVRVAGILGLHVSLQMGVLTPSHQPAREGAAHLEQIERPRLARQEIDDVSLKTSMCKVFGELFFTVMPRKLPRAKMLGERVLTHARQTSSLAQRQQVLGIQPQSQLEE